MRNTLHTRFGLGCVVFACLISETLIASGHVQPARADARRITRGRRIGTHSVPCGIASRKDTRGIL